MSEWAQATREAAAVPSTMELIDRLARFDGPPEQFLLYLLAVQCHLSLAGGGGILRAGQDGRAEVVAVYPPLQSGSTAPPWLAQAVQSAGGIMQGGQTVIKPYYEEEHLYGTPARHFLVMIPLMGGAGVRGVAAYAIASADNDRVEASRERLELTVSLLSLYEMRLTLQRRQLDLRRLRMSLEVMAAINEQARSTGASMAFCNEIASRWQADRVGLGFLKGRYVALKALSHTEKFNRKMKLIQDLEAAMEECLDQDAEVLYPAPPEGTYVSRAAAELSRQHGPHAVSALPLRRAGEVVGVLIVERPQDKPFTLEDVEALRLAADLCTARLEDLHQHDRWIGGKAARATRKALAAAVGPKHTWAKAIAILVAALLVFIFVAKGDHHAEGPFVVEATQRQVVPAPFKGFLKEVPLLPGDPVEADKTVLASLDKSELELQLNSLKADYNSYRTQADIATRDGKLGERDVALRKSEQTAAQMELVQYRLKRADIVCPISGLIVAGDLQRRNGSPVEMGDVLFEVAPIESLRAEVKMPEDQVIGLQLGQAGELIPTGHPDVRIRCQVERINPVAELDQQENVFRVRVKLLGVDVQGAHRWLRPGMEGTAAIDIPPKRCFAWLWTRRPINWFRQTFWWLW